MQKKLQKLDKVCYENAVLIDEIDEDLANIEKEFHKEKCENGHKKGCDCKGKGDEKKDQELFEDEYEEEDNTKFLVLAAKKLLS